MSDFMKQLLNPDWKPGDDVKEVETTYQPKPLPDINKIMDGYVEYLEKAKDHSAETMDENNPAQMEGQWMAELRSYIEELTTQINYLNQMAFLLGTGGTQALIQYVSEALPKLESFRPRAEALKQIGLTQMSTGLEATITDLQKAFGTYLNIYQGGVRNDVRNEAIMRESSDDTTQTILETNANTQKVYNRANENWEDKF